MARNGTTARGLLGKLYEQRQFKRRPPDKLAGFWRRPSVRYVRTLKPLTYAPQRPIGR
jgi:hypothetical protein